MLYFLTAGAAGLTSFITERSKQERRQRQKDERHLAVSSFLFGKPKRKRKIFLKFLAVFFNGGHRGVLLLSSPKEVSKKGATVSTRWTPTRGNPWTPHSGKQSSATSTGFYPAHPAGRGYTPYRSGKRDLIGPTPAKKRYSFTAATKNVSPGLQGKAGSRRG